MKIEIHAIGRAAPGPETEMTERYLERAGGLARNSGIRSVELIARDIKAVGKPTQIQSNCDEALLAGVANGATVIILDERGQFLSSQAFAKRIENWRDEGAPTIAFLIGGAYGHGPAVRERAALQIAFGAATWPHMLVRAMLAEQIYRSLTLLCGHPYHKA